MKRTVRFSCWDPVDFFNTWEMVFRIEQKEIPPVEHKIAFNWFVDMMLSMSPLRLTVCVLSSLMLGACIVPELHAASATDSIQFNRDIRPILSDKCFYCHGPDKNHRKGKMRLDVREEALAKEAFVPGNPDESELVRRIFTEDDDEVMPPTKAHKPLTAGQKDLLKRWVTEGALYQKHWAYEPPVKPEVPAGENGIDFLVGKRLNALGLKPSPEADRRTLDRRLHFDLAGIPPTVEAVSAFEKDNSNDAYEKRVDDLIASPRFGERMAIGWLDVVRFADTIGYHSDTPRNIWPYRDYVINAFNDNKPFDKFTREQLAGDLLPNPTQETRVASAFNRLLLTTEEGGAQPKDYEARMLTDRVRAVSAVWLGQTVGCAQCHDHKFDPIKQRDFYSLGAFFADIKEPIIGQREDGMMVPNEEQAAELAKRDAETKRLQDDYDSAHPELSGPLANWERIQRTAFAHDKDWTALRPTETESAGGAKLDLKEDASILVSGKKPDKDTYTLRVSELPKDSRAIRIEALPDDSLPSKGPGRAGNGNFVLSEVTAAIQRKDGTNQTLEFSSARAGFEQTMAIDKNPYQAWSAAAAIDRDTQGDNFGWAILPEVSKRHHLVLQLTRPLSLADGETLVIALKQNNGGGSHTLGHFRIAATANPTAADAALPEPLPEDIIALLTTKDQANDDAKNKLLDYYKANTPQLAGLREQLAQANKSRADYEGTIPRCLVSVVSDEPRTVRLLPRGNWMNETGEVLKPALPGFLTETYPVPKDRQLTRLDLAEWLVSPQNPLTARVTVNRLWKQFFGLGLSKTLDDLGTQGEQPVNPELLDWLACEFRESGWDVKHMVRLMVNSRTYRQTSAASPEQLAGDPDNRELARQSRWRIDAELVRDNALTIAGMLNLKIGGPSAKPYQPAGYWENLNFPQRTYQADTDENEYRRGLYTWWQRSYVHPSMLAFDAPTREECAAERSRSNIPQQALVLLNDPTYVEAARVFAGRIVKEGGVSSDDRIRWAWQQALMRQPDKTEMNTLRALAEKHAAEYAADRGAAEALLKVGLKPVPENVDAAELATWTSVARVILNLHETITRS